MLSVWWYFGGVIHWELLEKGQSVNSDLYCAQLERVNEKIRSSHRNLHRSGVILLHDNARPHVSKQTKDVIAGLGWEVLNHPPYSPDISPTDYHLFRSMAHSLAGQSFGSVGEVLVFLKDYFASKPLDFYQRGIDLLTIRWQKVVDAQGDYSAD